MKLISFKSSLAAGHVLLALALLIVGHFEERAHRAEMQRQVRTGGELRGEWELRSEFDYMPRARIWLLTIDSPPFLLSLPVLALVGKFTLAPQLVFLLAVGLFWYWIGSLVHKRANLASTQASGRARGGPRWMQVVGLLGCITLLGFGIYGFFAGGSSIIIDVATMCWGLFLGVYFIRQLRRTAVSSS